jgi:hypothetical protein
MSRSAVAGLALSSSYPEGVRKRRYVDSGRIDLFPERELQPVSLDSCRE